MLPGVSSQPTQSCSLQAHEGRERGARQFPQLLKNASKTALVSDLRRFPFARLNSDGRYRRKTLCVVGLGAQRIALVRVQTRQRTGDLPDASILRKGLRRV